MHPPNPMTLDPLPWRAKIAPTLRYAYFSAEAAKNAVHLYTLLTMEAK